jgi:hypothetical protein
MEREGAAADHHGVPRLELQLEGLDGVAEAAEVVAIHPQTDDLVVHLRGGPVEVHVGEQEVPGHVRGMPQLEVQGKELHHRVEDRPGLHHQHLGLQVAVAGEVREQRRGGNRALGADADEGRRLPHRCGHPTVDRRARHHHHERQQDHPPLPAREAEQVVQPDLVVGVGRPSVWGPGRDAVGLSHFAVGLDGSRAPVLIGQVLAHGPFPFRPVLIPASGAGGAAPSS